MLVGMHLGGQNVRGLPKPMPGEHYASSSSVGEKHQTRWIPAISRVLWRIDVNEDAAQDELYAQAIIAIRNGVCSDLSFWILCLLPPQYAGCGHVCERVWSLLAWTLTQVNMKSIGMWTNRSLVFTTLFGATWLMFRLNQKHWRSESRCKNTILK